MAKRDFDISDTPLLSLSSSDQQGAPYEVRQNSRPRPDLYRGTKDARRSSRRAGQAPARRSLENVNDAFVVSSQENHDLFFGAASRMHSI